jgi:hypothetical protein
MKSDGKDLDPKPSIENRKKKTYVEPTLILYGSVEKITEQTGSGTNNDQQLGGTNQYSR